jgi:type IV pilus biogenesis/stability protein PilW
MVHEPLRSIARFLTRFGILFVVAAALACASTPGPQNGPGQDKKARAHYNAGISYMGEGKPAMAIRELRTALQSSPRDPWIHWGLAEAYRRKGRLDEAESHLLTALEIRPGFQQARLNLSAFYYQVGRYDDVIEHADLLLDDPTFPVPWKALANKGWAQYKLGQRQLARRSFVTALEYDEKHWRSFLGLGMLDMEAGRRIEALEQFERVLELEPGPLAEAEVNYWIGEIYVSLGNRERALRHLTAVTAKEPNGQWGKRSADYLRRLR